MNNENAKYNIINWAIYNNKDVNQELTKRGYDTNYNPFLVKQNWAKLPSRAAQNAKNIARDAVTFGGEVLSPAWDIANSVSEAKGAKAKVQALKRSFKEAVNNEDNRRKYSSMAKGAAIGSVTPIGILGGSMLGYMYGDAGAKGTVDALLSPYNINTNDIATLIKTKDKSLLKNMATRVGQGVFDNPIYTGLDLAPVATRPISKAVRNIPQDSPKFIRQIFPDKFTREVNRELSNSLSSSAAKLAQRSQGYNELLNHPLYNRHEMLKNIVLNTGKLTEDEKILAKQIKDELKLNEQEAINLGLISAEDARANTIAQYAMKKLNNKNILFDDVYNRVKIGGYLGRLEPFARDTKNSKVINKLEKYIKDGSELYDNGKISFFTEALAPGRDKTGHVIAKDINKVGSGYFGTKRIIGNQDLETLSSMFDDSIRYQLNQVNKFTSMDSALKDITDKFGVGQVKSKAHYKKMRDKGYIGVNVKELRKAMKDALSNQDLNVNKILEASISDKKGSVLIDSLNADMIKNAFEDVRTSSMYRRMLNTFKRVALASPHWIALNRVGNLSNNLIAGVSPKSVFVDAIYSGINNLVPDRLKQQTAFNSYVNNLQDVGKNRVQKSNIAGKALNSLLREYDKFKYSDKSLKDLSRLLLKGGLGFTNDLITEPFFKLESVLELHDRVSNFVHQAKKIAKEEKRDWRDVLREAKTDDKLYNKINNLTNKDLGDYMGRNYALPNGVYDALSGLVPFYRFLSQTGRTTANQIYNSPLAFNSAVVAPSKYAAPLSEKYIKEYGLNEDYYNGGKPYLINNNNGEAIVRTQGFEPLPALAVMRDLMELGDGSSNIISPTATFIADTLGLSKNGRSATSKERYIEGKEYKKNFKDILSYALWNSLRNMSALARQTTGGYLSDLIGTAKGKGIYSRYDVNPLEENLRSYKKIMPLETFGKFIGMQSNSNYRKPKQKASVVKNKLKNKSKRQSAYSRREEIRNKELRSE